MKIFNTGWKKRKTAIIISIFLGWIGAGQAYLNQPNSTLAYFMLTAFGIMYLTGQDPVSFAFALWFLTCVCFLNIFDIVYLLCMDDELFDIKYNKIINE